MPDSCLNHRRIIAVFFSTIEPLYFSWSKIVENRPTRWLILHPKARLFASFNPYGPGIRSNSQLKTLSAYTGPEFSDYKKQDQKP